VTCQEIYKLVFIKFIDYFFKRLCPISLGNTDPGTLYKIMVENHRLQPANTIKIHLILLVLKRSLYDIVHVLDTAIENVLILELYEIFALLGQLFIYELLLDVGDGGLGLLGDCQTRRLQ